MFTMFVSHVTGITQEQIDMTRLATEHQMLADVKDFAAKGGDLEVLDHKGATLVGLIKIRFGHLGLNELRCFVLCHSIWFIAFFA